jgi:hypothetical protein
MVSQVVVTRLAATLATGFMLLATAGAQSTPPELRDLVGARAAGGESQLQARGYAHAGTETGADRKWGYWWHAQRRQCIVVATSDGRYASIATTPAADCGKANESSATATPAELRDLVGTRASGGEPQLRARGYTALGALKPDERKWSYWWNAPRRQCIAVATVDERYASIISAPVDDCRKAETANASNAVASAELRDLVGMRAAGGEVQLQTRGYVATDVGADRKWVHWWNARRRQCVAVATVDGRYQSIISRADADCGQAASAGTDKLGEPDVTIGKGGVGLAVFVSNNCVISYTAQGARMSVSDECRPEQALQADEAIARARR